MYWRKQKKAFKNNYFLVRLIRNCNASSMHLCLATKAMLTFGMMAGICFYADLILPYESSHSLRRCQRERERRAIKRWLWRHHRLSSLPKKLVRRFLDAMMLPQTVCSLARNRPKKKISRQFQCGTLLELGCECRAYLGAFCTPVITTATTACCCGNLGGFVCDRV